MSVRAVINASVLKDELQKLIDKNGTNFNIVIESYDEESYFGRKYMIEMATDGLGNEQVLLSNKRQYVGPAG